MTRVEAHGEPSPERSKRAWSSSSHVHRAFALCLLLVGCTKRDGGAEIVVTSSTCVRCEAPVRTGALQAKEMDETSGLVASSQSDDVFFAHNDSGDTARFFAIDRAGKRLATFVYSREPVIDCEDIARGPCAGPGSPSCLFIADIGDNDAKRSGVRIARVREPDAIADTTLAAEWLPLVYPDGPHDAETLLAHPTSGVLTIITKVKHGASGLYEVPMPLTPGVSAKLVKVGALASPAGSPRFTGGDVHPQGKAILLRTYTHVYYVPMASGQSVAAALAAPLCSLPVAREDQGESIAWTRAGDGFLTTSEGVGAPVSAVHCALPQ